MSAVVAVVEDQDGDSSRPSEPIFHSGLDASRAGSVAAGLDGWDAATQALFAVTLELARQYVGLDSRGLVSVH